MKVLLADALPQRTVDQLQAIGIIVENKPKLKAEELAGAINNADVLVVRSTEVHADCISTAKNLSLIIRAGAGVNNIDMKAANARGIYVSNCPGKNSVAVAELAMGLLLSLDRRIPDNVADLRNGKWNKSEYSKSDGIFGKTVGVIGVGQIGKEFIVRAKAFGMNVIAWSRSLTKEKAEILGVVKAESIATLIPQCDIITVHLALKPETKGIITKEMIGTMKPKGIFLNTSRWEVVDEEALYEAALKGAVRIGADVFSGEPEDKTSPFTNTLASLSNVYGTHHIGASTEQAQNAIADETVAIIKQYVERGTVKNWVNKAKSTPAKYQLVVRHYDKPGVLANVFDDLKSAKINIQEVDNLIFEGTLTACCTLKLDVQPPEQTLHSITSRVDEVIQIQLVALS
ncbi:MAG: 3-phosphoglycerate dehydrogenase family protein [Bacteroidetes bacterium]|nr:3-phosphoglycerate dehydrogenase family protein [Bacteroidota bacterium]